MSTSPSLRYQLFLSTQYGLAFHPPGAESDDKNVANCCPLTWLSLPTTDEDQIEGTTSSGFDLPRARNRVLGD